MIQGAGAMGRMHVALAMSYRPRAIVVADLVESRLEVVRRLFGPRAAELGIDLRTLNPTSDDLQGGGKRLDELCGRRRRDRGGRCAPGHCRCPEHCWAAAPS